MTMPEGEDPGGAGSPPAIMTIREAAAAVGVTRNAVGLWVRRGLLAGQTDARGWTLVSVERCRQLASTTAQRRASGNRKRKPRTDLPEGAPEGSMRLRDLVETIGLTRMAIVSRARALGISPILWRAQYWYTPEDADRIASAGRRGRPPMMPRNPGEEEEAYLARLAEYRRQRRREAAAAKRGAREAEGEGEGSRRPRLVEVPRIVTPSPSASKFLLRQRDRREAQEAEEELRRAREELCPCPPPLAGADPQAAAMREAARALEEEDRQRGLQQRLRSQALARQRAQEAEAARQRAQEAMRWQGQVLASQRARDAAIERGCQAGAAFVLLYRPGEGDLPGHPCEWLAGSLALLRSGQGWQGHSRWHKTGLGRWESTPYQPPIHIDSGEPLPGTEEQAAP